MGEYYAEIFIPNMDFGAQEDFCYFQRDYNFTLIKRCKENFDGKRGTLYFLKISDREIENKKSLLEKFPRFDILAFEETRTKRREDEKRRIKPSDFGRLFSLRKPRPSFA